MATINWLHLTDFHQGMGRQSWLWPTVRNAFYSDLGRVLKKLGGLDLVFFTGDLTQQASRSEFERLNETLSELWVFFKGLGLAPVLVPVPGNHDLQRSDSPYAKLMRLTSEASPHLNQISPKASRKTACSRTSCPNRSTNG
ncbi:metallophosphoesterase family protein, partial [Corallococcus interemptor]|uniref:metallophosphoesterase family protein n=1 Tax=Corallococcus interemptor TaxID=2316720 RepID=UPI003D0774CE